MLGAIQTKTLPRPSMTLKKFDWKVNGQILPETSVSSYGYFWLIVQTDVRGESRITGSHSAAIRQKNFHSRYNFGFAFVYCTKARYLMQLVQWNLEGCFCAFYASVFGRHILHIENFQLYKVNIAGDYFCQIIRIDCNGAWIRLRALFSCQLEFSNAEIGFITVEDLLRWRMDKTAGVGVSLTAWWQDFQVDNIFRSTIFSNRFY